MRISWHTASTLVVVVAGRVGDALEDVMRTPIRLLVLFPLVLALAPWGAAAASATRAPWTVVDSRSSPGAYCTYDGGNPRRREFVPVRMPRIFWPNTHPGRTDSGTVGWRIELQVALPGQGWQVAYDSSITKGRATDRRPAKVAKLAINWRLIHRVGASYRVRVFAYWYRPRGGILMSRSRTIRWYRLARALHGWAPGSPGGWSIGSPLGVHERSCPNLLAP
jgi:hypothetical protein